MYTHFPTGHQPPSRHHLNQAEGLPDKGLRSCVCVRAEIFPSSLFRLFFQAKTKKHKIFAQKVRESTSLMPFLFTSCIADGWEWAEVGHMRPASLSKFLSTFLTISFHFGSTRWLSPYVHIRVVVAVVVNPPPPTLTFIPNGQRPVFHPFFSIFQPTEGD